MKESLPAPYIFRRRQFEAQLRVQYARQQEEEARRRMEEQQRREVT